MNETNFSTSNNLKDIDILKGYLEAFQLETINFLGREKHHVFRVNTSQESELVSCEQNQPADTILILTCLTEAQLENALCSLLYQKDHLEITDFNPVELYQNDLTNDFDEREEEIFIRENGWLKKIYVKNINWIKVEGVYTHLACKEGLHTLRNTAKCVFSKLPKGLFYQIHKCYYVNRTKVDAINATSLQIGENILPIGRTFHKTIMKEIALIS